MILADLFGQMAGQAPMAQRREDPLDTIKGGLLAQLLGRVSADASAPMTQQGFDPSAAMVDGFAMPAPPVPNPNYQPPAPPMATAWSDQAPTAAPAPAAKWTDQAPAPTGTPTPAPLALPPMPVKDIAPQAAFGAAYTAPPPEAPTAPPATAAAPGGAPGGQQSAPPRFEASVGERVRAFGRALQGADPGDPGKAAEVKNQTMDYLLSRGMAPTEARALVSNPALLQAALPGMFQGKTPPRVEEIYDDQGRKQKILINPSNGAYTKIGGANGASDNKPPSGFEWVNPNDHTQGLKAIAGGPATHMTSELAGKLALMDASQKGIAATKDVLLKPWGAVGAGQALAASMPWVGDISTLSGEIGIAKRNVRAGIEAALRVMTGAAAPEPEVRRYLDLFMPGVNDTKESAAQKLGLLDQFMNNAREIVTRGRTSTPGPGGAGNGAPGAGPQAPQGAAPPRDAAVTEARAAIAAGKNPDAVRARLAQWGYSLD